VINKAFRRRACAVMGNVSFTEARQRDKFTIPVDCRETINGGSQFGISDGRLLLAKAEQQGLFMRFVPIQSYPR
jgi:hypothetical protein